MTAGNGETEFSWNRSLRLTLCPRTAQNSPAGEVVVKINLRTTPGVAGMGAASFGLIALAIIASAGMASAHDAPDFKTTAHKIAVASLLGDYVQALSGNRIATPDAGFDALGHDAMARQIATDLPEAKLIDVDAPRDALLDAVYPRAGFGDVGMEHLRAALVPWAAVHPVDYIVVLRKVLGEVSTSEPAYSITTRVDSFGIGLIPASSSAYPSGISTAAFLNITVLDGKTLDVVADLSVRDLDWGSIAYGRKDPTPDHLPTLISDAKAMLASIVPGLTHGVGL